MTAAKKAPAKKAPAKKAPAKKAPAKKAPGRRAPATPRGAAAKAAAEARKKAAEQRAVEAQTAPEVEGKHSVKEAAALSRLDLLRALRDNIAERIDDDVPARDLASLSKRLLDITAEIASLVAAQKDAVTAAANQPDEAWNG